MEGRFLAAGALDDERDENAANGAEDGEDDRHRAPAVERFIGMLVPGRLG